MSPLVGLASYPKSGSTWLRVLLASVLGGGGPVDLNRIPHTLQYRDRSWVDETLGLETGDFPQDRAEAFRAAACRVAAERTRGLVFVKTHDAFRSLSDGSSFLPPEAVSRVVYAVRNPLDVAVSYAHHRGRSLADTVRVMADPSHALAAPGNRLLRSFSEALGTWSGHVASWLDQRRLAVHVVRYEDLLAAPEERFSAVLAFLGVEADAGRVARAVEESRFERLWELERRGGFAEKDPRAGSFFRAGRAGAWRDALPPDLARRLLRDHAAAMERLGYAAGARELLA